MSDPKSALKQTIVSIFADVSKNTRVGDDTGERTFVDRGFDIAMLEQASRRIKAATGVAIDAHRLRDDLQTIDALAGHLALVLAMIPEALQCRFADAAVDMPPQSDDVAAARRRLDALMRDQMAMVEHVIALQLDAVRATMTGNAAAREDDAFGSVPAMSEARAFWANMYRDQPPALELPSDRPPPAQRLATRASVSGLIDATVAEASSRLAAERKTTLQSVLLAAFDVLLARLADADDFVVTVRAAGMTGATGRPVRQAVDAALSFAGLLGHVDAMMRSVEAHQDLTSREIEREFGSSWSKPSSCRIAFDLRRPAETFERELTHPCDFDLAVEVIEADGALRVDAHYDPALFDAETVERWIGHYGALLRSATELPDTVLAKLHLLEAAERNWLVDSLNATVRPYDCSATVHGLIAAQARRTPDAAAVVWNGRATSYLELERASDRLAGIIRQRVAGRGGRIAVAVERSVDMLVALIATMKAGHAYVPLDPTHPPQRLRTTLDAARVSAIIADNAASVSWAGGDVAVFALDTLASDAGGDSVDSPQGSSADDPAYVIFTSGSTGVPKGVEVGQRAVVNFLLTMAETPGFTSRDHLLAVTTVCFDIAGLELFLPLVTGGSLTIASREQVRDGFALVELLEASRATLLQATPSLWQILLEAGLAPRRGLKMLCGGEPLPRDLADRLTASGGELWNMYGPTETTIWSSCGRVGAGPITIGAPIANTQLFVLDPHDQLRPTGVAGDLYIGGDGLANGYFGRPDLTAAAFREVDIGTGTARRLYRTGDVARRMPDGTLQLHGRRDQQIKLRGYRIEIEDIESVLRKMPAVASAAVAVRDEGGSDARLVAFVVPASGGVPKTSAIIAHAATALPDYMVPASVVFVETLPMTGNGKLDRKALKALPLTAAVASGQRAVPPASGMAGAQQANTTDRREAWTAPATTLPDAREKRLPSLTDYRAGAMRHRRIGR